MPTCRKDAIQHAKAAISQTERINPPERLSDAMDIVQAERLLHQALIHLQAIPESVDV